MPEETKIKFENFSFSYDGKNRILDNITFDIKSGERILILGPSGCGKSTLTLCLNGIIPQLIDGKIEGNITIDNMDVLNTPLATLSRYVGIVFQDPESQFCMLKVEDEVAFGLENLLYERKAMKKKIMKSLSDVDLQDYKNWVLNRLSGGMKQRVSIASLLAINQEIMIFDEPTSNLDPRGTGEISDTIRKLPQNKTLIIIEHKLDEFIDIFNRILLLDSKGKLIASGNSGEIFINHYEELQKLGVWIPQIPKYICKLHKNNIAVDNFPVDIGKAKTEIESTPERDRAINILKEELRKNIGNRPATTANFTLKPIINIKNLNYKFKKNDKWVLKDINFSIDQGDFLGIVGQNGSGKTTLAKLIINLYKVKPPSKIEVYQPGKNTNHPANGNEILEFTGFVFQNPEHQFIEDTVYKEISYGLKIKSADNSLIDLKVREVLELLELKDFENVNPFNLSQGQKRRLSVASILVMDHPILILDEPTFGMDWRTTTKLMDILTKLNRQGKTIIIITHDMNLIFKYTHKVAVLREGRLAYFDYTTRLLGKINLIDDCHLSIPPLYRLYREVESYAVL
jgi:energy-coupling factor transporter ATP-binding protein EcfA2